MDFITQLSVANGFDSIMVVVDRFTKYEIFVPCKYPCTAELMAQYLFSHVVKHWGVPLSLISDRDPRFTLKF